MPTKIPPIHQYRFNGTFFVHRVHQSAFLAALVTILLYTSLFPANVMSTVSHREVSTEKLAVLSSHEDVAVYIKKSNAALSDEEAQSFARYAVQAAETFKLNLPIFLALIKIESGFKPDISSRAGALGLTQVIPKYHQSRIIAARKIVDAYSIYEPRLNLYVGAWALRDFIDEAKSLDVGLLKYNGSTSDPQQLYVKAIKAEAYIVSNTLKR